MILGQKITFVEGLYGRGGTLIGWLGWVARATRGNDSTVTDTHIHMLEGVSYQHCRSNI